MAASDETTIGRLMDMVGYFRTSEWDAGGAMPLEGESSWEPRSPEMAELIAHLAAPEQREELRAWYDVPHEMNPSASAFRDLLSARIGESLGPEKPAVSDDGNSPVTPHSQASVLALLVGLVLLLGGIYGIYYQGQFWASNMVAFMFAGEDAAALGLPAGVTLTGSLLISYVILASPLTARWLPKKRAFVFAVFALVVLAACGIAACLAGQVVAGKLQRTETPSGGPAIACRMWLACLTGREPGKNPTIRKFPVNAAASRSWDADGDAGQPQS